MCIHTVPQVRFNTTDVFIHEPEGPAEICVVMDSRFEASFSPVVTAQTVQKAGAANEATGTIYNNTVVTISFYFNSIGINYVDLAYISS